MVAAGVVDSGVVMASTFVGPTDERGVPATAGAATAPPPPGWFRGRSAEQPSSPVKPPPLPAKPLINLVPEEDAPPPAWWRRMLLALLGFAGAGYGISLLVHAFGLCVLAVWVVQAKDQALPFQTILENADGTELNAELQVAAAELSGSPPAAIVQPHLVPVPEVVPRPAVRPLSDEMLAELGERLGAQPASGGGQGQGTRGDGRGDGVEGAVGRNAVRKGSFVVWTVPSNPRPWHEYRIIVQINIPDEAKKKYDRDDLSGVMRGSDDFEMPIGQYDGRANLGVATREGYRDYPAGYYGTFNPTFKRLALKIPGAARLVRDHITVHSDLLGETQEIEIIFDEPTRRGTRR